MNVKTNRLLRPREKERASNTHESNVRERVGTRPQPKCPAKPKHNKRREKKKQRTGWNLKGFLSSQRTGSPHPGKKKEGKKTSS